MDDLSRAFWARLALGLGVATVGGVVAHWLHVPLAFMLGALFACMAASVAGWPVAIPMRLRSAFMLLIGVFLGESFAPETVDRLSAWPLSIALAILYVPVAAWIGWRFYAGLAGLDRLTALFSAIPGGLSAVILFSGALGGDERRVALSQSLRIAIVVVTAPTIVFGVLGYAYDGGVIAASAPPPITLDEAAILTVAVGAAYAALSALGVPIPFLMAPLLASAMLRLFGVVEGALPPWLVETALVVVGGSIGCRFAGVDLRQMLALALWTVIGTWLLMALAAVFAVVAATLTDADLTAALLAFAPGGIAEMCLIALALDADPGFVAAHHIARILFILLATPAFAAWLTRTGFAPAPDVGDRPKRESGS